MVEWQLSFYRIMSYRLDVDVRAIRVAMTDVKIWGTLRPSRGLEFPQADNESELYMELAREGCVGLSFIS